MKLQPLWQTPGVVAAKALDGSSDGRLPAPRANVTVMFTFREDVWKASHGRYSTAFENISIVFSCSQL